MEQIEKIPFQPEIPPELLDKILMGEVVVFVGSGVSRLFGVPSWKGLALKYLDDCKNLSYDVYEKLKREKTDPLELLTICADILGTDVVKKQLKEKLEGKLNDKEKECLLRIYGYIRDLKVGYITTNYDSFLENALLTIDDISGKEKENLQIVDPENTGELNQVGLDNKLEIPVGKIVYLHGKAMNPGEQQRGGIVNNIILTLEDYLEHYKDDGKGKNFLKQIFDKNTFLFIGLGLKEFEIIQHIQKPANNMNHYLLLGVSSYECNMLTGYTRYYKILNIEPVFYNISEKGYLQLEDVLRNWSNKVRIARVKNYEGIIKSQKDIQNLKRIQESKDEGFE